MINKGNLPMEQLSALFPNMLQPVLNASTKTVIINISGNQLELLKTNKYRLCFAKKVGDNDFDVVWQSYTDFMEYNEISWIPLYQIFATNTFHASVKVKASCKPVQIGLGQQITLDKNGKLGKVTTGGSATSINLLNECGSIHPGINQVSFDEEQNMIYSPIYVSQLAAAKGEIKLTPKEEVLVWFEQNIETGTMFSDARSNAQELDLSNQNDITITYTDDQQWVIS